MKRLSAWLSLVLCAACASSLVERRVDETRAIVEEAQRHGAASCAPVELALSSVHLEFAQLELRQGNTQGAERHLILAEPNGKAALRLAKEGKCAAPSGPQEQKSAVLAPSLTPTSTSTSAKALALPSSRPARVATVQRAEGRAER